MYWGYRIVYDEIEKDFIIGEVYYEGDKPEGFCEATIAEVSLNKMEHILITLMKDVINCKYLIWDGKELR